MVHVIKCFLCFTWWRVSSFLYTVILFMYGTFHKMFFMFYLMMCEFFFIYQKWFSVIKETIMHQNWMLLQHYKDAIRYSHLRMRWILLTYSLVMVLTFTFLQLVANHFFTMQMLMWICKMQKEKCNTYGTWVKKTLLRFWTFYHPVKVWGRNSKWFLHKH